MFLLFVDTSDVEQICLELSLDSAQCHLRSPYSSREFHRDGPATAKLRPPIKRHARERGPKQVHCVHDNSESDRIIDIVSAIIKSN